MPSFIDKLKDVFHSKGHDHKHSAPTAAKPSTAPANGAAASAATSNDVTKVSTAEQYPPAHIDWSKFEPAGPTDARSPCPMINALCNHHVLPHDGRNISKKMAVNALTQSLNLGENISATFSGHAINMNPDKTAHTFDLDHLQKHGDIEHDVSLSRNDHGFGDNHSFNPDIWANVIETYGADKMTSFETVSRARYERVRACKEAHDEAGVDFQYGIKELILSYGESALLLSLLGDPEDGKIPVEYLKVLFEEARVPYNEGWRKGPRPITQKDMMHLISHLFEANEHKLEEVIQVEMGTAHATKNAVASMMPNLCTVM